MQKTMLGSTSGNRAYLASLSAEPGPFWISDTCCPLDEITFEEKMEDEKYAQI